MKTKTHIFILIMLIFNLINSTLIIQQENIVCAAAPTLTTQIPTNLTDTSITLNSYLANDGGLNTSVWFEYGPTASYGSTTRDFNVTHSIVDDEGDGNTESIGRILCGRVGDDLVRTGFEFIPTRNMTVDSLVIEKYGYDDSDAGITVDIYINHDISDHTWREGTLVKNNWTPTWTGDTETIQFTTYYEIEYGETYEIEFVSEGGTKSYAYIRIETDTSATTSSKTRHTLYDPTPWDTSYAEYGDVTFYGNGTFYNTGEHFSDVLTGLTPETLYHYRAVANNTDGIVYGTDQIFTTLMESDENKNGTTYGTIISSSHPDGYFNVTRHIPSGTRSEANNCSNISLLSFINVTLKIPVSKDTRGILQVCNNTDNINAVSTGSMPTTNNTYWYDSANQFVYIRTINLTKGKSVINWTINCSYGATFNIVIPPYLTVGDYLTMEGFIEDEAGKAYENMVAQTTVYYSNGSIALGDDPKIKRNCSGGNYHCEVSTASLIPGIYTIDIEFTDTSNSVTYNYGGTLYLSYNTPSGIYSDAVVFINWYNTNQGLGLPTETLVRYIDGVRHNRDEYYTYIGNTFNLTIKDYYNTTLYSQNHTVDRNPYPLDFGITFHEYDFANLNEEYYIISFLKQGASRWYELVVPSRGHEEVLLPTGNYTIRVYNADNSTYISWSDTINNSKGYTIDGNNITQIIEGLSVVSGNVLQLIQDVDYALMPDEIIWSCNPIQVFSAFDRYGMMLGNDVWKVCPPKVVIATTRNDTFNGNVTFVPLIPDNDTSGDGSISIQEDIIWFSGTANWVNITWADNNTVIQNTSFVPSLVYLTGGNITVNCSHDLYMMRETTYSQVKKFYWDIYNSTTNPGYISARGGYHKAAIDVVNSLNTSLYNVRVLAGFSNRTEPDLSTARVRDIDNGVITDDQSEDFKTTGSGIEFKISGSVPPSTTRNFVLEYYGLVTSNYVYSDVQREILAGFERDKPFGDYFYNYDEISYHNSNNVGFKGAIRIRFNINMDVDSSSIKVTDLDFNRVLESDEYIPSETFVYISNEAIGTVSAGGIRNFGIYWQEEIVNTDPTDFHLGNVLFYLFGIAISWVLVFIIIFLIPMIIGVLFIMKSFYENHRWSTGGLVLIIISAVLIIITLILFAKGL